MVSGTATRNDLYQKMIEEIQDYAIILIDMDGIIQNWNKGAEKIKLYKEHEIVGKHFSIFYLPEDLASGLPAKLMREAMETGRAGQEGWRKRKDGSRFWGSITITALHDEDKNVIGFCKVTRDLSEKKSAEEELKLSEQRYHRMIAEVQDYAIILLSVDGVIENWNAGAESIKGYKAGEVIGKKFEVFYTPEDRESDLPNKLLMKARVLGKATHEGWRVRKDGTRFWGRIVITALHKASGEVIGFSKVTRDRTEQKMAEEKLAVYLSELELQNNDLEQFAYVASHDLQEPLRKIRTFAELIKDNYDDRDFVNRYLEKLDSSAKRMVELVQAVLNYSSLSKNKDNPVDVTIDLNDILNEVRQDFELLIEEKKAIIHSGNLPVITGNPIQLGQLFSNLIGNSLKFSNRNPVISINAEIVGKDQIDNAPPLLTRDHYYHITFGDNGIGFEEQYSNIVFSLFQRLHGKQLFAGTGIGLALCRKIVENHRGFICANSVLGEGTTFSVYLPVDN